MQVTGEIKLIGNTVKVTETFSKRLLVLTTSEQYPQDLPIEFVQAKTSLLDKFEAGQVVNIGINLRGREHEGKYYSGIQGWKIELAEQKEAQQPQPKEDHNDLPF